jgi:hypothetical protein
MARGSGRGTMLIEIELMVHTGRDCCVYLGVYASEGEVTGIVHQGEDKDMNLVP